MAADEPPRTHLKFAALEKALPEYGKAFLYNYMYFLVSTRKYERSYGRKI